MKFFELELKGKTLKFRLTSNDCMTIEKQEKKSIVEFMQNMSMSSIITLLRYMRRSSQHDFSEEDATQLYDDLVDEGYTLEDIINDIILEALVVSGFMKKDNKKKDK